MKADTSDLRELARIADADPRTFYRGVDLATLDVDGQDLSGMQFGFDGPRETTAIDVDPLVFTQIARASRYEERLVFLLKWLIEDRTVGLAMLDRYIDDRSKHGTLVLAGLRSYLDGDRGLAVTPMELVRFVRARFSHVMPGSRAAILYYMAIHLANHEEIRAYLLRWWSGSSSFAFRDYQKGIELALNAPERPALGVWSPGARESPNS